MRDVFRGCEVVEGGVMRIDLGSKMDPGLHLQHSPLPSGAAWGGDTQALAHILEDILASCQAISVFGFHVFCGLLLLAV